MLLIDENAADVHSVVTGYDQKQWVEITLEIMEPLRLISPTLSLYGLNIKSFLYFRSRHQQLGRALSYTMQRVSYWGPLFQGGVAIMQ